jgi:glycerophosphoryl diester phosphodiesterase
MRSRLEQGADWIEPDLVITSDGVLVARHENEISETTDVGSRPEYAGRRTTKVIEGKERRRLVVEDFTLAELKTLRARERLPQLRPASAAYDRQFQIATLDEIAALVRDRGGKAGRPVGIVAELKHAAYFDSIGLPLDRPLLAALDGSLGQDKARVIVESFEPGILRRLNRATEVRLVQLLAEEGAPADSPGLTFRAMATQEGLARIRGYADGIGAAKGLIVRAGPAALACRRPRLWKMPSRPDCSCSCGRSAARTPSYRPSCAAARTPPRGGTRRPSIACSTNWASTACSATSQPKQRRPARSGGGQASAFFTRFWKLFLSFWILGGMMARQ